jgi:hypothetical protein
VKHTTSTAPPLSTNSTAVIGAPTCQQPAEVRSLVRPGSHLSPRLCACRAHGAQGRVKPGRRAAPGHHLDGSRPWLDGPSAVLRSREAVPIFAMANAEGAETPAFRARRLRSPANACRRLGGDPTGGRGPPKDGTQSVVRVSLAPGQGPAQGECNTVRRRTTLLSATPR